MGNYLSPLNTKLDADQVIRRSYDEPNNRLRVDAQVSATIGSVDVIIDAATGDNIAISDGTNTLAINPDGTIDVNVSNIVISHTNDSIKVGDGTDFLAVNPDGSINVNVNNITGSGSNRIVFNEITSVASATLTTIASYTVPVVTSASLQQVLVSGTNIAAYEVYVNAVKIAKKRTYFSDLNEEFIFAVTSNNGYVVSTGDVVEIKVLHDRPTLGDFEATIQLIEA